MKVPDAAKASGPLTLAEFPATIELATRTVPASFDSPPPLTEVELPLMVQFVRTVVPESCC